MRQTWTDDRMDDLVQRVDSGFAQVHDDIADLRADNRETRQEMARLASELRRENKAFASEMRTESKMFADSMRGESKALAGELRGEIKELAGELRGEANALRNEMNQRFDAFDRRFDLLFGTMLTGFAGLIVSHFVG